MREIAKYLNIDFQKAQKIEKGRIRLNREYLPRICKKLNLSLNDCMNKISFLSYFDYN